MITVESWAHVHDITELVRSQLPRLVAEKVELRVVSDPYHLRTVLLVKDERGQEHECILELIDVGGRQLSLRVPDQFLAHLSVVV